MPNYCVVSGLGTPGDRCPTNCVSLYPVGGGGVKRREKNRHHRRPRGRMTRSIFFGPPTDVEDPRFRRSSAAVPISMGTLSRKTHYAFFRIVIVFDICAHFSSAAAESISLLFVSSSQSPAIPLCFRRGFRPCALRIVRKYRAGPPSGTGRTSGKPLTEE